MTEAGLRIVDNQQLTGYGRPKQVDVTDPIFFFTRAMMTKYSGS